MLRDINFTRIRTSLKFQILLKYLYEILLPYFLLFFFLLSSYSQDVKTVITILQYSIDLVHLLIFIFRFIIFIIPIYSKIKLY